MKPYVAAVALLVLVASLFGVVKSFSSPTENTFISKPASVLDYKQEGQFDYVVTAKPAFFYDNEMSDVPPETSPQIPVKFVNSIVFSYAYESNTMAAGNIEINAILENPGAWKKTINLVPQEAWAGTVRISFPIDLEHFQEAGNVIEKEIGSSGSSYSLTLQAVVSVGTGSDHVQLLPIKMTRLYIKIGDDLTSVSSGGQGRFDYQIELGENALFGPVTLTPPAAPPKAPGRILGPTDTIVTKLIDSVKVNYTYRLTSDSQLRETQEEVIIEAILENPDRWSKTYTLVPRTFQNGDLSLSFPLDLQRFRTTFDTIQQETGIPASTESLTLKATLRTLSQTDVGSIDTNYTQSIKTNMRDGVLTWTGDLKKSEPGSIEFPQLITETAKMLGIPVLWFRILSIFVVLLMLTLLGVFWPYIRPGQPKSIHAQTQAKQLTQKYKELIVEVRDLPEVKPGQTVLSLDSFQDLIKVAQGLLKPVHHVLVDGRHIYWVYDETKRYEYQLSNGKVQQEEHTFLDRRTH